MPFFFGVCALVRINTFAIAQLRSPLPILDASECLSFSLYLSPGTLKKYALHCCCRVIYVVASGRMHYIQMGLCEDFLLPFSW